MGYRGFSQIILSNSEYHQFCLKVRTRELSSVLKREKAQTAI